MRAIISLKKKPEANSRSSSVSSERYSVRKGNRFVAGDGCNILEGLLGEWDVPSPIGASGKEQFGGDQKLGRFQPPPEMWKTKSKQQTFSTCNTGSRRWSREPSTRLYCLANIIRKFRIDCHRIRSGDDVSPPQSRVSGL